MSDGEVLRQILEVLARMDKRLEFLEQMQKALHHHEAFHLRPTFALPNVK